MKPRMIATFTAATLLLGGCGSLKHQADPPLPPPAQETVEPLQSATRWVGTQFEDIPIPSEFSLDYGSSYLNVSAAGPRVADLRYTGQAPLTRVLTYVQRAMADGGWQLMSLTGVAIKTLRFVKQEEECVLVIHKGPGGGSVIMVRIHPRP